MTTTTMLPREVREGIHTIDSRLSAIEPWATTLTNARERAMLHGDTRLVQIIDDGLRAGEGLPPSHDRELLALSLGQPGLASTRREIDALRERRALLERQRPSEEEVAATTREAEERATKIRTLAADLDARAMALRAALVEAARLAIGVAEDARQLWLDNLALDRFAAEADVARPATARCAAPAYPLALPLSALLAGHLASGGSPEPVDSALARAVRSALGK